MSADAQTGVFHRLLVAYDGSAQAERAIEEAVGLAWVSTAHMARKTATAAGANRAHEPEGHLHG